MRRFDTGYPEKIAILKKKAMWANIAFGLHLVALLVNVGACILAVSCYLPGAQGETIDIEAIRGARRIIAVAQWTVLASGIGTIVSFLFWFKQTRTNLSSFFVRGIHYHTLDAVAGFFVPIINLWRPLTIALETWKASDPNLAGPAKWKRHPASILIISWWIVFQLSWACGSSINYVVAVTQYGLGKLTQAEVMTVGIGCAGMEAGALVLRIIAAILAMVVVNRLTGRQSATFTRLLQEEAQEEAESRRSQF